jgi:hypothetical protein
VESLKQAVAVSQDLLRVCATEKKRPQISPLRYASPGFPVELGGVHALHAAFLNESSTRGHVQRCVAGNPGPVEMTIPFKGQVKRFQDKYEILAATELSSRPEESWACGPPKVMKNASDRHPLSMEPLPFPCHPDRSGGTCGSADPSWRCFSTERSVVKSLPRRAVGSAVSFTHPLCCPFLTPQNLSP